MPLIRAQSGDQSAGASDSGDMAQIASTDGN
jgi:hypothetical protein